MSELINWCRIVNRTAGWQRSETFQLKCHESENQYPYLSGVEGRAALWLFSQGSC